jgi:hypothetical protein
VLVRALRERRPVGVEVLRAGIQAAAAVARDHVAHALG